MHSSGSLEKQEGRESGVKLRKGLCMLIIIAKVA